MLLGNYIDSATTWSGNDLTLFMGADDPDGERTVTSNHSDYNVYARRARGTFMRHSWNPNNTLEQWRERFAEDMSSSIVPVDLALPGTGFRLLSTEGLNAVGPIPEAAGWQPKEAGRAGCSRTVWPGQ